MKIPVIQGLSDRRILINYRIDPAVLTLVLPPPFRPKLINGVGMAGICLIRLKEIRPRFAPGRLGITSENAAHRIAVEWNVAGETREGVYIPRRDTSSRLNALAGGRVFPGLHQPTHFEIEGQDDYYRVVLQSHDQKTSVAVECRVGAALPAPSVFKSFKEASDFFARGSMGYSATAEAGRFDGLELRCQQWQIEPLTVTRVHSSFFEDSTRFPAGSVEFDCALLMRGINHEWHSQAPLRASA